MSNRMRIKSTVKKQNEFEPDHTPRTIENLVDEMIKMCNGNTEQYVATCEMSVANAKESYKDSPTKDNQIILEDSIAFLTVAEERHEQNPNN